MRPLEQTILAPPDGNCFAACVASVLEMPLDDVPNFVGQDWFQQWQVWLAKRNLQLLTFTIGPYDEWRPSGYALLGAQSPRGDFLHSVVCRDGKIVWDPHPQRDMGVGEWRDWTIFAVLDPARPILLRGRA
jgi:hypothetical protein